MPEVRITEVTHYNEAGQEIHGKPTGSIMTVAFELDGDHALVQGLRVVGKKRPALADDCVKSRMLSGRARVGRRSACTPLVAAHVVRRVVTSMRLPLLQGKRLYICCTRSVRRRVAPQGDKARDPLQDQAD